MAKDFPAAFSALREVMRKHSAGLTILVDTPTDFTVVTPAIGPNKKPIWFGAVLSKKSAVTYHLFPLYFNPKLQAAVPAELLARKQGKTCFNFQKPDEGLFALLDELTAKGRAQFEKFGLLKPGAISQAQMEAAISGGGTDVAALAKERKEKGAAAAKKRAATLANKAKPKATRKVKPTVK